MATIGFSRLHRALSSRPAALLVGLLLGAPLVAGVAIAQGGSDATLIACAHDTTGDLRLVASTDECRPQETPVSWNQIGPEGPPGPQGPPGGGIGVESVATATFTFDPAGCPAGEYRLVLASQSGAPQTWSPSPCAGIVQPSNPVLFAEVYLDDAAAADLEGAWMLNDTPQGGWTLFDDGPWRLNCFFQSKPSPLDITSTPSGTMARANCALFGGVAGAGTRMHEILAAGLESEPLVWVRPSG